MESLTMARASALALALGAAGCWNVVPRSVDGASDGAMGDVFGEKPDAEVDGDADAGADAARDEGIDVVLDVGEDAALDAAADTGADAGLESAVDAPAQDAFDASADGSTDVAPGDAAADVRPDAAGDVVVDAGPPPTGCAGGRMYGDSVAVPAAGATNLYWVAVGDIDRDGDQDVVLSEDIEAGRLILVRGGGDGTFDAGRAIYTGSTMVKAAEPLLIDVDRDGLLDVVASYGETSPTGSVMLIRNLGGGSFASPIIVTTGIPSSSGHTLGIAAGDVNDDGRVDVVTGGSAWVSSNNAVVAFGLGFTGATAAFASNALYSFPVTKMFGAVVADLDHVGGLDVVFARFASSGGLTVALSDTSGLRAGILHTMSGFPIVVRAGDVNADGWNDLVSAQWASGTVGVLINRRDGTFASPVYTSLSFSNCNSSSGCLWSLAVRDLNDDGRADLASVGQHDNRMSVLLASMTGTFSAVSESYTVGPSGTQPRALASGDFNRDGRPDMIVTTLNAGVRLFTHCW